jgi:biotin carboxyl carrier protein
MSDEHHIQGLPERIRALADVLTATDLIAIRIERDGEEIELGRKPAPSDFSELPAEVHSTFAGAAKRLDLIKADLVGIFHLSRPAAAEGDLLEVDRELAYIEALGIRNPIRSHGAGRIVSIRCTDGEAVDYGAALFEIDRG